MRQREFISTIALAAVVASAALALFFAGCGGCGESEAERAQRIRTEIQTECDASCTAVTGDEQKHCESTCVANAAANMIASRNIPSNANMSDSPWFWLYLMSQNNQTGATRYVERERVFRDAKPFNEKSYPYAQKHAAPAPSTSGGSSFWPSTGTSKSAGSLPSTTSRSYGGSSFSSGSSKSYGGSSFGGGGSSSRSYGGSSFGGGSRSYGGSSFGGGRR